MSDKDSDFRHHVEKLAKFDMSAKAAVGVAAMLHDAENRNRDKWSSLIHISHALKVEDHEQRERRIREILSMHDIVRHPDVCEHGHYPSRLMDGDTPLCTCEKYTRLVAKDTAEYAEIVARHAAAQVSS